MLDNLIIQINNNIKNKIYDENNKIYVYTNENLKEIFDKYDVKGKRVLTVLASSDQLLSCLYMDAKEVDTFDRSYVTFYYYYLRKWLIEFQDKLYPSQKFLYDNDFFLYRLIYSIYPTCEEEKKAKLFWLNYLETNDYKASKYLFESRYCKGDTPFDNDIMTIKSKLPEHINFYCMDFFNRVNLDKKYDVIILSNMLEYENSTQKKIIVRENLEKLLDNNGIVICSYKVTNKISNLHLSEKDILTRNKLVLDKEFSYYEPIIGQELELAYSYKKVS